LFGDMQIAPFNYVKRSREYDASKWPLCAATGSSSPQADVNKRLPQIRDDHNNYIIELARYTNEVSCVINFLDAMLKPLLGGMKRLK